MNKFGKILLPFITSFEKNEDVNYHAFADLIEFVIKRNYCDTIIVTGTTGEFNTLTFEERVKLFETAIKANKGRKPIIAGTGCASTKETCELTKVAVDMGIDTCMVVAPFYCKPTQDAIYDHYNRVIDYSGAKILVYNIPIFTGVNVETATLARLAKYPNVIGVKDESGINPTQLTDYYNEINPIDPNFLYFNGDDIMLMPTLAQGVTGIVSGGAQTVGDRIRKVFDLYLSGKVDEALAIYRQLYKLYKLLGINGRINPIPMARKSVEIVTGIKVGNARGPLNGVTAQEEKAMRDLLTEMEVI
jgi:4-hydroxy-tetrahydrodipicolinate synthase